MHVKELFDKFCKPLIVPRTSRNFAVANCVWVGPTAAYAQEGHSAHTHTGWSVRENVRQPKNTSLASFEPKNITFRNILTQKYRTYLPVCACTECPLGTYVCTICGN